MYCVRQPECSKWACSRGILITAFTAEDFDAINTHLAAQGLMMREGTIVDATLIAAWPIVHFQKTVVLIWSILKRMPENGVRYHQGAITVTSRPIGLACP